MQVPRWLQRLDERIIAFTRRYSLAFVRWALGIVFVWFGILKLAGRSPVEELVAETLFWLPSQSALNVLGAFEVVVGAGLLTGWAIRVTLFLFAMQMVGTFLVFFAAPHRAFQSGNPLLLTEEGEFVLKNLVLLTSGVALASTVRKARKDEPLGQMLTERPGGQ
jgi:uncharacterized membrane protein YkgB